MINKMKHLRTVGAAYLFLDDSFWWTDSVPTATAVFKFRARRLTTVYPNYKHPFIPFWGFTYGKSTQNFQ